MRKCYIITSYIEGDLLKLISPGKPDFIICADGGYEIAGSYGVTPDLVIGDSDSGKMDAPAEVIRFPREKDESDTFLCVKHAVSLGFQDITVIGGMGGRFDHTMANIQTLAHFSGQAESIAMADGNNYVTVLENSRKTLRKRDGSSLSIFSLSDTCEGVTTTGLSYPLSGAALSNKYPIGLSNEFTGPEAVIEVKNGKLLIVMSCK